MNNHAVLYRRNASLILTLRRNDGHAVLFSGGRYLGTTHTPVEVIRQHAERNKEQLLEMYSNIYGRKMKNIIVEQQ